MSNFLKFIFLTTLLIINLNAKEPSLRSMASQMVMVGFNGSSVNDASVRAMLSDASYARFGGVVLFGRNIKDKDSLKKITKTLKEKAPKIFIAIDEEGGKVSRLESLGFKFDSAKSIADNLDIDKTKKLYNLMSSTLKDFGINMNFAPVVDLHDDNSPIIGKKERAFSSNGIKVSIYARVFMDAMQENNIISVIKHFPGHGASRQDSHKDKSMVILTHDAIFPYKDIVSRSKAKAIMVGHLYVQNIDNKNPATLSDVIINQMLRKELGFNGVIISDDMLMKGVGNESLKQKIVKFINAGGDILLFSDFNIDGRKTAELVVQHIVDAVNDGRIGKDRLKISYERIIKLKREL